MLSTKKSGSETCPKTAFSEFMNRTIVPIYVGLRSLLIDLKIMQHLHKSQRYVTRSDLPCICIDNAIRQWRTSLLITDGEMQR